jgi:hypothetical protein
MIYLLTGNTDVVYIGPMVMSCGVQSEKTAHGFGTEGFGRAGLCVWRLTSKRVLGADVIAEGSRS